MTRKKVYIIAAFPLAFAAILLLSAVIFGPGGRGFFSPDTLQARTQGEYLIPLIDVPVYRTSWSVSRWPIVDYLVAKGYWSALEVAEPRWVSTFQWNRQWRDGESSFYRELVWRESVWIKWSEEHPDLAKVMWPRVLSELRKAGTGHPLGTRGILSAARMANSLEEFKAMLKE